MPGHPSGFCRLTTFIFEKRPPRDAGRQISNVAADAREVSFTRIVDETRRWFTGFQIPQRFKQESSNLNDIRVAHPEVLFGSVDDGPHTLRCTCVLVQEFFDPGEIECLLNVSVLEIIVADVAKLPVIGANKISLR